MLFFHPRCSDLRHALKRSKRILVIILAFFWVTFSTRALITPEEEVLEHILADKGENWICYWQFDVWDGSPNDPLTKVVPGISGYSAIDIIIDEQSNNLFRNNIIIENFIDNNIFTFIIWKDASMYNFGYMELQLDNDKNQFGLLHKVASSTSSNYGQTCTIEADIQKEYIFGYSQVWADETSLNFLWQNNNNGILMSRNWEYVNNKIDIRNLSQSSDVILDYFHSLHVSFIKQSNVGGGVKNNENESENYPILYNFINTGLNDKFVDINNFYNIGKERGGNAMFDYTYTNPNVEDRRIRLQLTEDNQVYMQSSLPGMLQFNPLRMTLDNTDNTKKTFKGTVYDSSTQKNIYYTDYLILAPGEFEKTRETEYVSLQSLLGNNNLENNELSRFMEDMKADVFEAPTGKWTVDYENTPNPHWDRETDFTPLKIHFNSHSLLPILYKYNGYGEPFSQTGYKMYQLMQVNEPLLIETIDVRLPLPAAPVTFSLTGFGHNILAERNNKDYVYIEGNLNGEARDSQLYLANGKLMDFANANLEDAENGCKGALLLSEKYRHDIISDQDGGSKAITENNRVAYLVPVSDIGDAEGEESNFTLYAKYKAMDGNMRFKVLSYLDDNNITTSVSNLTLDKNIIPFVLSEGVLFANAEIVYYEPSGRRVGSLLSGQNARLTSGVYIINDVSTNKSYKLLIK